MVEYDLTMLSDPRLFGLIAAHGMVDFSVPPSLLAIYVLAAVPVAGLAPALALVTDADVVARLALKDAKPARAAADAAAAPPPPPPPSEIGALARVLVVSLLVSIVVAGTISFFDDDDRYDGDGAQLSTELYLAFSVGSVLSRPTAVVVRGLAVVSTVAIASAVLHARLI